MRPSIVTLGATASIAVAAILGAQPASSGEIVASNGALVVHVSPAGLDLSTPQGAEALRLKVRLAARALCEADGAAVMSPTEMVRCSHDAYASAHGALETALAASHTDAFASR
jgi:UrcA family protein